MHKFCISILFATALLCPAADAQTWELLWNDEFDGLANTSPSPQKWAPAIGGGGWGNQELQTYSNSIDNVYQDGNGNLVIRALRTPTGEYTSARLSTEYAMAASYGKVEARIKLPTGKGIWPSFWMLGTNISTVGWPQCGEIDIMEHLGDQPAYIHSTIHGPGFQTGVGVANQLSVGQFSDTFHTFGAIWSPRKIEFQVDGMTYATMTPNSLPPGSTWVFERPFYLILNLAVGGVWPGYPDASTTFPQSMLVDYVRYYRDTSKPVINPGQVLDSVSLTKKLAPGSVVALSGTGFSTNTNTNLLTTNLPTNFEGTSVIIGNKAAALLSVSPTLILAQVPWETPVGTPATVQVFRNGNASNTDSITPMRTAPSVMLDGAAAAIWCLSGAPQAGTSCTIVGDGFGAPVTPLQNGYPATSAAPVQAACRLTIGNIAANVTYCGMAPGTFMNRVDFVYPAGVPQTSPTANALLILDKQSVSFPMPSPR